MNWKIIARHDGETAAMKMPGGLLVRHVIFGPMETSDAAVALTFVPMAPSDADAVLAQA